MRTRKKHSRGRRLLGLLVDDPWRKLAAIVLAFALWFYLDKQISKSVDIILDLEAVDVQGSQAVGLIRDSGRGVLRVAIPMTEVTARKEDFRDAISNEPITSITLSVQGERGRVDDLLKDLVFVFNPGQKNVQQGIQTGFLVFSKDQIENKSTTVKDYNRLIASMKPERVKVLLQQNDSKPLTLAFNQIDLQLEHDALGERILTERATFEPPTITLRGPRDILKKADEVEKVFRARVDTPANTNRSQVRVVLELLPAFKDVVLQGGPVQVTYPIRPDWKKVTFENHPVHFDTDYLDFGQKELISQFSLNKYVIQSVEFEVSAELEREIPQIAEKRRAWARQHLRLVVTLDGRHVGEGGIPPGGSVRVKPVIMIKGENKIYVPGQDYRGSVEPVDIQRKKLN